MLVFPTLETFEELLAPLLDGCLLIPRLDRRFLELDENALAHILDSRQPIGLAGERGGLDSHLQFAFNIGHARLESSETNLRHDLAEPVDQDNLLDGLHPKIGRASCRERV